MKKNRCKKTSKSRAHQIETIELADDFSVGGVQGRQDFSDKIKWGQKEGYKNNCACKLSAPCGLVQIGDGSVYSKKKKNYGKGEKRDRSQQKQVSGDGDFPRRLFTKVNFKASQGKAEKSQGDCHKTIAVIKIEGRHSGKNKLKHQSAESQNKNQ